LAYEGLAAFTPQDISLVLISVRGWVDLRATEVGVCTVNTLLATAELQT